MTKLTIYLKNKEDLVTPTVLRHSGGRVVVLKNKANIENIFGASAIADNIYLQLPLDSIVSADSGNYDYYIKIINIVPTPFINIINDEKDVDELRKINFLSDIVDDSLENKVLYIMIEKDTHYNSGDTVLGLSIFIKKTLKNRPLRNKGINKYYYEGAIDEIKYVAK